MDEKQEAHEMASEMPVLYLLENLFGAAMANADVAATAGITDVTGTNIDSDGEDEWLIITFKDGSTLRVCEHED